MKDQKKRDLLKAKIAVALQNELERVPTEDEINHYYLLTRVMYKAVLGTHYRRQEQKKNGQLPLFLTHMYRKSGIAEYMYRKSGIAEYIYGSADGKE